MKTIASAIGVAALVLSAGCTGSSTPTAQVSHSAVATTPETRETVRPQSEQDFLLKIEQLKPAFTSNDQVPVDIGYGICGRTGSGTWQAGQLRTWVQAAARIHQEVLTPVEADTIIADAISFLCSVH